MDKKILRNISIWKTFRFNKHYFGWKGIIFPAVFVARSVKFYKLGGTVKLLSQRHMGMVKLGFPFADIFDYKYERFIWSNSGEVVFEGTAYLGQGNRISNHGKLFFGDNIVVNSNSTLICHKEIEILRNVMISWNVLIIDTDFHRIYDRNNMDVNVNDPKKIIIGEKCWIGCRSLLLKGSRIANNVIIAAESIISGELDRSYAVYGERGKVLKQNVEWKV